MKRGKWYAYFIPNDNKKGITESWDECNTIISGVPDARFKKFDNHKEAQEWIDQGADYGYKSPREPGVYFDSGTGRGRGVEISVTDEKGESVLAKVLPKKELNRFGAHWMFRGATNNYGELYACFLAIRAAMASDIKRIFGDSTLVLEYWSKGIIKNADVNGETVALAKETAKLRKEFEKTGGTLEYIDGAQNPADLGFHR
ncbi:MAG: ribonuclease HI [Parcubacteria group bacterium Gr01-1014_29]|nr:MAG: ribonuclease HI [Parcubacteria group bacterium Gr01-1014_29]